MWFKIVLLILMFLIECEIDNVSNSIQRLNKTLSEFKNKDFTYKRVEILKDEESEDKPREVE